MQPVTTEYSVRLVIRTRRSGMYTPERKAKVLNAIKQKFTQTTDGQWPYTVDVCEVRETRTMASGAERILVPTVITEGVMSVIPIR